MNNEYFILEDEEQVGPFSFNELIARDIDIHTSILAPKANEWQYASELPELYDYFEARGIYFPTQDNLASFGWRILAFIIDYFILGIIAELISVKFGWIILPTTTEKFVIPPSDMLIKVQGVFYTLYLVYNTLFELTPWKGSLGKKICGLRVVDVDGQSIGFLRTVGRNIGSLLSIALAMVPYLSILGSEYKQEWYDNLAKAYMIKKSR